MLDNEDKERMESLAVLLQPIQDNLEKYDNKRALFSKFIIGISSGSVVITSSLNILTTYKNLLIIPVVLNVISLIFGIFFLKKYSEIPLDSANESFLIAKQCLSSSDKFDKSYKKYKSSLKYWLKSKWSSPDQASL